MAPRNRGAPDILDADMGFSLNRLFDHYNMDHIPEEKRLDSFKKRDLNLVRSYKAAVRIFGGPLSRKRVIVAPPMETPLKHRLGLYHDRKSPIEPPTLNSNLQPQVPPKQPPSEEKILAQKEKEKYNEYQKWINERKKVRNDLNNLGLNETWLANKKDKTELETRVMHRVQEERKKKIEPEGVRQPRASRVKPPSVPVMVVPSPVGLQIIDEHVGRKRWRLIDLFQLVDKRKSWAVSKEEFARCIEEAQLDITDTELEDLIFSLDADMSAEVEYAELARGMEKWKKERRGQKRESLSGRSFPSDRTQSGSQSGSRSQSSSSRRSQSQGREIVNLPTEKQYERALKEHCQDQGRPGSQRSTRSEKSGTPNQLEVPPSDLRPEVMMLSSQEAMVDLRKHDQEILKNATAKRKSAGTKRGGSAQSEVASVIKTGNKAIDNHSMPSTMGGEIGEMVNRFRQERLKEYYDVVQMCKDEGVPLTQKLLERVLLYPPDLAGQNIERRLSQPGKGGLLSVRFTTSPKPSRTPLEVQHKDKMKRTKSGKLLIDSRHIYPSAATVSASVSKESLSTGRALISRKTDCWMTFEEYDRLTGHLAVRYKQLHGNYDENAFWPGHLLNKLRLCMPPFGDTGQAIFSRTHQRKRANPGYHNDLQTWPRGPQGHVTIPTIERQQYNLYNL